MKIFDYRYRAKRLKDGKIVRGITEAPSKSVVERFLTESGLKPIEITQQNSIFQRINRITIGKVIKERDLIFYLKQLSSLLRAGVKLNEASEILATQQTNKNIRRILYGIYYEVNSGQTLADSFKEYPNDFPQILVSMVAVGEKTGDLKGAITQIIDYFETQYRLKSSISSTMMMPVIYLVVGLLVAAVLTLLVMPQFESMFDAVDDVEMPGVTRFFIDMGNFVKGNIVGLIIGLIIAIIAFRFFKKKSNRFQIFLSATAIRMPIIGQVVKLNNLSRIASTLSQMLNNHVPLQDSLATTYDTIGNKIYKDLIIQAQKNVNAGEFMSTVFENHYAIEVVFARMVSVGERTGELGNMLKSLSAFYDEDSEVKIEQLKKAIEPILLLFIFSLITVMLLAVMLPTFSFTSQL
ncbi:MAG: type II secretion system F family protein [Firmicutes bacterium]|nr:type II secretion system F family protein [Bacillota bacterium]